MLPRRSRTRGVQFLLYFIVMTGKGIFSCGISLAAAGFFLLRDPTLSHTQVAFSYAGNIWIANRDGGGLRQLTHGVRDRKPCFSPDGSLIAFSADLIDAPYQPQQSGGIFVVPASGGVGVRQLTFHPGDLAATGWTPDGKQILFTSTRADIDLHHQTFPQLFSVPVSGGNVSRLAFPAVAQATLAADGQRMAYVPNSRTQPEWRHYRGGQTTPIWIANLADSSIVGRIPRDNSNDFNPMWIGNTIYFLSDRSGAVTLFAYDVTSKKVRQVIDNDGLDINSATAYSDDVVYEQFGSLHLLNITSGRNRTLDIQPRLDLPALQPHLQTIAADEIRFARLSPNGRGVVFGLHGDVLTVNMDNKTRDIHNVTRTTNVEERDPSWSPDGRSLAYFSDESGEYALHIRDREGRRPARKINLGDPPSFYYNPVWSPEGKKIAFTDVRLNYWFVELNSGKRVHVDTDLYVTERQKHEMTWSADGLRIAYTRLLPNSLHAVFVYSLEDGRSYQITDGRTDALHVAFDQDGKHLYFTASTDLALAMGWDQMSSLLSPVTRSVYSVDLGAALEALRAGAHPDTVSQLINALSVPARNYCDLIAGASGTIYLVEWPQQDPRDSLSGSTAQTKMQRLDLKTGRMNLVLDRPIDIAPFTDTASNLSTLRISADGKKILYAEHGQWFLTSMQSEAAKVPPIAINLDSLRVYVDPRSEWKHMFEQIWRDERDFFYDPRLQGVDLAAIRAAYEPFLGNIATREDLYYLFNEMLGNLTVGHMAALREELPPSPLTGMGYLGADYNVDQGHYRFSRIYHADPWNPEVRSPLDQPTVGVRAGDILLAINGHDVHPAVDIYSYFENLADRHIALTIAPHGDLTRPRKITVIPVADETPLRNYTWVEDNRRRVETLGGGRVAYVYLPDVYIRGYRAFNRDYFAQIDKQALIIDERYNYGGFEPDYIIDCLSRPLMTHRYARYGRDITTPQGALFGPKAMIINEMAISGGDLLPWMFRKSKLGVLVGTRTWGGLTSGYTTPDDLIDGTFLATPGMAFYDAEGAWLIENYGVAPDIEVEQDPKAVREGHDPQLEKAVEAVLEQLQIEAPARVIQHPAFPNYQGSEASTYQTKLSRSDSLH